ncbi:MAG TPA: type II CRISPR-associated endonuclease Cas1 [Bacteroidia bacterium]|jgi:CRISPR-associated protein Cas1|nr:type II CRISPR-associated endonuclease Cas1 [Bacteroidia bacterium]
MIKRTLYFGNPASLRLKDKQLQVDVKIEEEVKTSLIAVEDIGVMVIDSPQITLTSGLLQALQENNVAVIICDYRHMPQSLLLPIEGNSVQQERYDTQLAASEPLKKQLWAQTVTQKIKNQAAILDSLLIKSDYLIPLHRNVKSGDSDNCEATAAVYYWQKIFGHVSGFARFREGPPPNNYLNYGYSILRGTMARSIVAAGLLPTLGIFHRNRYNAFCLADDLMEPYRPYVDEIAYRMVNEMGLVKDLEKEHKAVLLKIPAMDVTIDGEKSPLMIATQRTAVSLVKCFAGEQRKLVYPEI